MLLTGSPRIDAERAFDRALRARRRAAVLRRLRPGSARCGVSLAVYHGAEAAGVGAPPAGGVRPIALDAIRGTTEPSRARLFDACFRPAAAARRRWQRLWLAEQLGAPLPPVSLVAVGGGAYAIRDGHHRVSVARARGGLTIDATVERPAAGA